SSSRCSTRPASRSQGAARARRTACASGPDRTPHEENAMTPDSANPAATADPFVQFKAHQRAAWAHFGPLATFTATSASRLVRFAGVKAGQRVLDVGSGTGVVAITAARVGAKVTGSDLTPELLEQAKATSALLSLDVEWREADAEHLPF